MIHTHAHAHTSISVHEDICCPMLRLQVLELLTANAKGSEHAVKCDLSHFSFPGPFPPRPAREKRQGTQRNKPIVPAYFVSAIRATPPISRSPPPPGSVWAPSPPRSSNRAYRDPPSWRDSCQPVFSLRPMIAELSGTAATAVQGGREC